MSNAQVPNPYVGPRTFTYEQRHLFFGREREARDLLARVVSERVLLFYAQSGAGKSSLLHTRLIPQLREEEGFAVLPVGRVSGELPAGVEAEENIYLFNLMASLDQSNAAPQRLAGLSLCDFLANLTSNDGATWYYTPAATTELDSKLALIAAPEAALSLGAAGENVSSSLDAGPSNPEQRYVLIIDQFEEIITTHSHRRQDRELFFRQLNQALLNDSNLWVVLTLREDYVAALDPYAHFMTDKLRARFYMERMGVDAALAAIKQPAALAGRLFAEGVAEGLVDNLRRVKVSGQAEEQLGQYIEPVQLQVVCYQLWQRVQSIQLAAAAVPPQITTGDLRQHGDVDRALSSFYEEAIQIVLAISDYTISERQLRTWFALELITAAQTRSTVYQGESETAGMPNQVVERLQAQFLLRTELRAGGAWIELVHDRLVAPIVDANQRWLQQQHALLRAAQKWVECDRLADFLYADARLDAALREAGSGPFDPVITEFVEASRAQIRAQQLQTRLFRFGVIAALSILLIIVLFALWTTTRIARNEAVHARDRVQRLRLATESLIQRELAPQRALLLAVEAASLLDPLTGRAEPQSIQALYRQFDQWAYWQQTLVEHTSRVNGVAFDSMNLHTKPGLFSVGADGRLLYWPLTSTSRAEERLVLDVAISAFAHHAARQLLALGTEAGEIILIDLAHTDATVARWPASATAGRISALTFTADGETLIGSARGQIHFWSLAEPHSASLALALPNQEHCLPDCWVRGLAVSADGQWLAAGGENHRLTLWRLGTAAPAVMLNEPFIDTVWTVAFSPDSQWLAAGDGAGELRLYALDPMGNVSAPRSLRLPELGDIRALAFSPVEPLLAIGDGGGVVGVLPFAEPTPMLRILGRLDHELSWEPINAIAFNAAGDLVATGGMDHTIRLWHLTPTNREPQELYEHRQRVRALALYSGPLLASQPAAVDTLVSAGEDGVIHLWSMTQPPLHIGMINEIGNQILAVAIHPQAKWLATGGRDGIVRLYPLAGDLPAAPILLRNHTDQIAAIAFSPDGTLLATGGADKHILLWSLMDLTQPPMVLANGNAIVLSLAFDRTGAHLASGDERWVKLWDLHQSPPVAATIYTHEDWVWKVAFSPDERWLASVSADSMLRLTPLQEGVAAQGPIFAHEQRVRTLAFAPDGSQLATAGDDALVRLWDPTDLNQPSRELQGHRGELYALAFRTDGKQLLSAGEDAVIRQWMVDLQELQVMACTRVGRNLTAAEWELFFPSTPYHVTCPAHP